MRSLALLLALIQILSLFTLGVGAAGLDPDGRWVKRSALSWARPVSNDDAAKRQPYYMLFDRSSGDNLSFPENISLAALHSFGTADVAIALPEGRDWKNENNYKLKLYGQKVETDADDYQFLNIYPSDTVLNYHHFQKLERRYTTGSAMDSKMYVPSGAMLSETNYYIVPQKYVEFAGVKPTRNPDGSYTNPYYTTEEDAAIRALFPQYKSRVDAHNALKNYILSQTELHVGGYHPQMAYRLIGSQAVNLYGQVTEDAFLNAVHGEGYDLAQTQEFLSTVMDGIYDYVESSRIDAPEITSFELGGSKARIDAKNRKVTVNIPLGYVTSGMTPAITTNGYTYAQLVSGSTSSSVMKYKVTPYCPITGLLYNGQQDTSGNIYTDLSQEWTVELKFGEQPFNDVTSFSIYDEKYQKQREATIVNPEKAGKVGSITLNMPFGTDRKSLVPTITHMGQYVQIEENGEWKTIEAGKAYDFSTVRKIRVKNDSFGGVTTEYTVTITAELSSECKILGYKIGYAEGEIDEQNHTVNIEVPYGTDLTKQTAEVTCSEFAENTIKPSSLAYNMDLTYVIKAENGATQKYTVRIAQTAPATGKNILSFSYGSISAKIGEKDILLEVPFSVDLKTLAPTIVVSDFATVSPVSNEAVDFTNSEKTPVIYTVRAQDGTEKKYNVVVKKAAQPDSVPYGDILEEVKSNIIADYKSRRDGTLLTDDWILMNLGFATCNQEVTSGEDLPYGLNIYGHIKAIAPNKMTDYGRVIMMLTALGINASNLDIYRDSNNTPFTDSSGKAVSSLVKELYSYSGSYTINGPIYALIALDMGNYTVPKDAKWTREKLLEEILSHQYGSDGFGIDMVAMLMQSLYPYINDPTYGERVKAKMQEGYDIILGYQTASGVDPMGSDYTFFSWGTTNSESCAQVICAMCAMGVDVGTDPNFSAYSTGDYTQDKGVIPTWLNRYLMPSKAGFGHTDNSHNEMATYQSAYAVQWYLNFYNEQSAKPYSLYYKRFDFSRQLSDKADIEKFTLEGQEGIINGNNITVYVPDGMPTDNLTPEIKLSDGAKLLAPKMPVPFVEDAPVAFTVQAENGTTKKTYSVKLVYDKNVKGKGTTLFTDTIQIQNEDMADKDMEDMQITKNEDGTTDILITIVPGVDTTKLRFKADISYKAKASIDVTGKSNVDLHDWTEVVVTAEDGETKQTYRIKVVSQTFASITEFAIKVDGVEYGAVIAATGATGTIRFVGIPDTADLTRVVPTKLTLGEGTTEVLPSASAPQNFAEGAEYTVKGPGLRTRTYSVVTSSKGGGGDDDDSKPVNNSFAITSFKIGDKAAEIDNTNGIIKITLPYGTNLYQVAPKIETGSGCVVSPRSGQVVNLSVPATYTLTRGDEKRTYTVIVTLQKSASQLIWDKAALKMNPSSYQTSPDLGKKDPEPTYIPSTSQILSGMKVQVNGKDVVYQATGSSGWLLMTPDSYSAANTYRFRAEKGALKNIVANGYNGFGIQAGKLMIGITEKMDTARGLDLSLCPVPSNAQTAWKNKSGVVGVWKITCDSVSGGLTLTFDCSGQTGKLALAKYNEAKKCFEQVSEKKWSVSGSILTASNMSAGIYGVIKIG